jgi:hypothetical protein
MKNLFKALLLVVAFAVSDRGRELVTDHIDIGEWPATLVLMAAYDGDSLIVQRLGLVL